MINKYIISDTTIEMSHMELSIFKMQFSLYVVLKFTLIGAFIFLTSVAQAESWDFSEKAYSIAVANEDKAVNDLFNGSKIVLKAQYFLDSEAGETSKKLACCEWPSHPQHFTGLLDAELHWGLDGTDLEFARLGFTPWATMWEPDHNSSNKLSTKADLIEYAAIRYITDDVLEVESYLEFSFLRAGRIGTYNWSDKSPFTVNLGIQADIGWSWAETKDPLYSSVSNPYSGIFFNLGLEHEKFGEFYTRNRFVNGFSFSSPGRGHPTVREARARIGYITHKLVDCFTLDVFIEKRSFYFDEGDLPGLYRKSAKLAVELACKW